MHTNINMNMREQRCNLNLYASTVVTRTLTLGVGSVHQTGKQGKLPLTLSQPLTASTPVYAPYC